MKRTGSAKGTNNIDIDNVSGVKSKAKQRGDFFLFFLVLALILFGVIMIFSASYYSTISGGKGPFYYLIRAGVWAICGYAAMIVLTFFPYQVYYKIAPIAAIIGIALLVALFTPLGATRGNASRWIEIGGFTLMPGEVAKITAIWFVAWFYTKFEKRSKSFIQGFIPMALLTGLYFYLIYKQPNLSTALIVCGIVISMVFFAGARFHHIALLIGAGIAGVAFLIISNPEAEHMKRIMGYWDPFSDAQGEFYQLVQSLYALGLGGFSGLGPGRSIQKALYLPEAQNDFIFAIIGEEFGFIGCVALLLVFLVLIWRCALVTVNAPDRFGMLVGAGITVMLALQVILNVAVVTGLLPPTGVTLPFISYGGNAMLLFAGAMGIMMNISRQSPVNAVARRGKRQKSQTQGEAETNVIEFPMGDRV